ncbi:hypothetical protein K492DRAFT_188613 [Lichtheimia hyalospora FSU 10163]|nr:hypothetical protein K492DRAFT_188613 [Lichtheimia hyalospora FSU 10163]
MVSPIRIKRFNKSALARSKFGYKTSAKDATTGERNRISLRKSQIADPVKKKKKEPTTGIPPRLWSHLVPPMPLITSTIYRHYAKGPPAPSWSLTFDITIAIITDFLRRSSKKTVEDLQTLTTSKGLPVPSDMTREKVYVPQEFRIQAGKHLGALFTPEDELNIGWDWRSDYTRVSELRGEWLYSKKNNKQRPTRTIFYIHGGAYYLGSYKIYRQLSSKIAKLSDASVFAFNYRLAPQHPFPAAVEDVLAAYMYLIDPPADSGAKPINPKDIVIAGDSAGGGLTFALLLALRDAGLPVPAGAMTLSPWVDLTHSFPSIIQNVHTDYLPPIGFKHVYSEAMDFTLLPQNEETRSILENNQHVNKDTIDKDLERIHFYAGNHLLKHPLVSPVFDPHHLQGLPPLLIQTGTSERLHDEAVYAALQASNHFNGNGSALAPTSVKLQMFVDQPHVFQIILPTRSSVAAIERLCNFAKSVTPDNKDNIKHDDDDGYHDNLSVCTISPRGHETDSTEELLQSFEDGSKLNEWKRRLARPSLRDRLEEVENAVSQLLHKEH